MRPLLLLSLFLALTTLPAQQLSPNWEELTASDFASAVKKSEGVCLIPIGVIEKHGQHLPLGTDVLFAREIARRTAASEYCVVFPFYFQGHINEAKHQPGTIAYSSELMLRLLDETCAEIARNGFKKIILLNGHGGNVPFLQYFCRTQLASPRDYAVFYTFPYTFPSATEKIQKKMTEMGISLDTDGHAGMVEASVMLALRPDLVKIDRSKDESGDDRKRSPLPREIRPAIAWYASYPNHYSGDARKATAKLGEFALDEYSQRLSELIKAVKADETTLRLQEDFFKESQSPLETKAK